MTKKTYAALLTLMLLCAWGWASAQRQVGKATYYHNRFHGRRTSNGEVYHKDSFTCAHKTLPFGTMVRVRDTKTDREVTVKVNDRLGHGTMIDLSYAAARELGILSRGTTTVEIEPFQPEPVEAPHKPKPLSVPTLMVSDPLGEGDCSLAEWGGRYNRLKINASLARNAATEKDSLFLFSTIEE